MGGHTNGNASSQESKSDIPSLSHVCRLLSCLLVFLHVADRYNQCSTPLKKIATPRDIANQIAILASSSVSGHVTGQVVMVEGGMEGRAINTVEEIGALRLGY
jgi:NAD(P)-dependent dehydrogenase (short-subunit alcohol dehydrogenase family)